MADQKKSSHPEFTSTDPTGLKLGKPKESAAGVAGVGAALSHLLKYMDPVRAAKVMLELNQKGGIDCPGCAWPDPQEKRSRVAEYCENGAKAIAEEATTRKLDPEFFANHSVAEMAAQSDFWIGKRGRIMQPMLLEAGETHYKPVEWNTAFRIIADELLSLDSPDDAAFYTSGRTSNEAAFLYQLFVRMFGTNNLPDCSNMCHESSGVALTDTLGIGKGSVKLEDLYEAEVILVIGQNPGTNHPRMLSALKTAKQNGAKIITVNPLPETGLIAFRDPQKMLDLIGKATPLTDLFLQVKINGDVALLKAIMKLLWDEEQKHQGTVFDLHFIEQQTDGYRDFIESLQNVDVEEMAEQCGVSLDKIKEAAALLMHRKKIIACWAMGLTQHKNGVENIQEVVNLLLLKGSLGKPGAGTCPVRGHSNVQGDRTMGIWEKPSSAFLDRLQEVFGFEPPRAHGLDVVNAIKRMAQKPGMVFFAMGGNFLSASPDTALTAKALQNCKLTAHVSTKLNRSHLVTGKRALILPALARSDQDMQNGTPQLISVENSMGIVHSSAGRVKPLSPHLLSEPAIVAGLAKATLPPNPKADWDAFIESYDNIREKIEAVIPGFENYNERVRQPNGFYLPNCIRDGHFNTLSGKANFTVNPVPDNRLEPGEYMLTTVRTHDQFNTTIYGLNDRYRGIYNERRVLMMNPEDMAAAGLEKKDVVDLISHFNGTERVAPAFIIVPYNIPRGCTATYFPEANVLVPVDSVAAKSNTPTSKMIKVRLRPASL
ncbi:MAG: FdhF/YdeP family oxidoreductase [Bacteroidia bacterium]